MLNVDTRLLDSLNENEFFALCHLAKYLGKDQSCFPSKGRLQRDTGFGRHKLDKAIAGLIEKGHIQKEQRKQGKANTFQTNIYTFTTEFISVYINVKGRQIADVLFSDNGSADNGSADNGKQDNKVLVSREVLVNKEVLVNENKGAKEFAQNKPSQKDKFQNIPGLKKQIGPKQHSALNEIAEDSEIADRLRSLWSDGRFDLLAEWLEHRKSIRKHATGKAVKMLLTTFEEFTTAELKAAVHKGIESGHVGLFPKKQRKQIRAKSEGNLSAIFQAKPKTA